MIARSSKRRRRGLVLALGIGLLGACAGNAPDPRFAFMQPGVTTRAQVLLEFGRPSYVFEQERIVIFLLELTDTGKGPITADLDTVALDLVVEFDQQGVLLRHAAVPP